MLSFLSVLSLISVSLANYNVTDMPSFWYTTTWPFCQTTPENCESLGLKYIRSSKWGNGWPCIIGTKVLCQVYDSNVTVKYSAPDELNIMTYNIYDLPYILVTMGQRERTCRIPRELYYQHPDMDLVLVQELFMEGCTHDLNFRQLMSHYGWKYSTNTLSGRSYFSGGVAIFSKYPLLDTEYQVFHTNYRLKIDSLSPKGFVYANAWDGNKIDKVRFAQGRQISDFLNLKNIRYEDPVILGGDLNFDFIKRAPETRRLFALMNMTMTPINSSISMTFNPDQNNVVDYREDPAWYDYVAYHNNHLQPIHAQMETKQLRSKDIFYVCDRPNFIPFWIGSDSFICSNKQIIRDLSDHYPVIARFKFPTAQNQST